MTDPSNDQWRLWGPLADRYREPRPRKILALDGGGIRGVITLGVLKRLEDELRSARGGDPAFTLSDFFDLIGGTSTGAIIATGLALGMSVEDITSFYHEFGSVAFDRRSGGCCGNRCTATESWPDAPEQVRRAYGPDPGKPALPADRGDAVPDD